MISDRFRVVVVGGGVAALEALLCLHALAGDLVALTILAPNRDFVNVPVGVQEPFGGPAARSYPLTQLAEDVGAELYPDTLAWLDAELRIAHTKGGAQLRYDALLLAPGASVYANDSYAVTLEPHRLDEQLRHVLLDIDHRRVRTVAFVIPSGPAWPLPIYELALMTAARAREALADVEITIVTPEFAPLAAFGDVVSEYMAQLLARSGVTTILSTLGATHRPGLVELNGVTRHRGELSQSGRELRADRIFALPQLFGPHCPGVPTSAHRGFISTDRYGKVRQIERTYAAGDATDFPVKFGAISAQQADVAAHSIAALAGASVEPQTFAPELRAVLLTGGRRLMLSARLSFTTATHSEVTELPAGAGPAKIAARYLAPYLHTLDEATAVVTR